MKFMSFVPYKMMKTVQKYIVYVLLVTEEFHFNFNAVIPLKE